MGDIKHLCISFPFNKNFREIDFTKEIFGEEIDSTDTAKRKRASKRRNGNCIDNIIDGSFMGMVLAICLAMVLGAAFFAYKNLYYAVIKKMYPDQHTEL